MINQFTIATFFLFATIIMATVIVLLVYKLEKSKKLARQRKEVNDDAFRLAIEFYRDGKMSKADAEKIAETLKPIYAVTLDGSSVTMTVYNRNFIGKGDV